MFLLNLLIKVSSWLNYVLVKRRRTTKVEVSLQISCVLGE